jgi:hypothetical protein
MTKNRYSEVSNTVRERVFAELPVECTHLECRCGQFCIIPLPICARSPTRGIRSLSRLFCCWIVEQRLLVKQNIFLWWSPVYVRWDNQLPQHSCMFPNNPHHPFSVKVWYHFVDNQLIWAFVFEGRLVADYYLNFLQDELPLRFEDVRLQAKLSIIPATRLRFISFRSKSHTVLIGAMKIVGLVVEVRIPDHHVRQAWHPLIHTCGYNLHEGLGELGEIAETRWTLTVQHRRCYPHTVQSWKRTGSNTCCFKTISLVHSQCRRSFRTASA